MQHLLLELILKIMTAPLGQVEEQFHNHLNLVLHKDHKQQDFMVELDLMLLNGMTMMVLVILVPETKVPQPIENREHLLETQLHKQRPLHPVDNHLLEQDLPIVKNGMELLFLLHHQQTLETGLEEQAARQLML